MKRVFLVIMVLLSFSFAVKSQKIIEVGVGRGAYGETYKQVGFDYGFNDGEDGTHYILKAAFGLDRLDNSKELGVRQVASLGAGIFPAKKVEVFTEASTAIDRLNGNHHRTQYGATFGANYYLNHLVLGVSYNTIPVFDTPNELGRRPFPIFSVGYKL